MPPQEKFRSEADFYGESADAAAAQPSFMNGVLISVVSSHHIGITVQTRHVHRSLLFMNTCSQIL